MTTDIETIKTLTNAIIDINMKVLDDATKHMAYSLKQVIENNKAVLSAADHLMVTHPEAAIQVTLTVNKVDDMCRGILATEIFKQYR